MSFEFSPSIAFRVKEYQKAIAFYQRVMGMERLRTAEDETALQCGPVTFYVEPGDERQVFFEFSTDDLEAAVRALRQAGCRLEETATPEGETSYIVTDPFGLTFHLWEDEESDLDEEGRPVPLHVQEHYLTLPVDKLIADVLRHYRILWPRIEALITARITDLSMDGMVMEGSALWPETVAPFEEDGVAAVWLTAADGLIQQRMHASSRYGEATPYERTLIDKFLQRTIRYNADMMAAVERLQLPSLEVARSEPPEEVAERILALIDSQWGDG